jgi:hypothetical protein
LKALAVAKKAARAVVLESFMVKIFTAKNELHVKRADDGRLKAAARCVFSTDDDS